MHAMASRTTADTFIAVFDRFEREMAGGAPSWLREARRAAIARFRARGLPTVRDEAWKYTSLAPIEETPLDLAPRPEGPAEDLAEDALAPFLVGESWSRLVFVNGRYSSKLSAVGPLPPGVRVGSLGEAAVTDGDPLRRRLEGAGDRDDAWTALNAAYWLDGALVHVSAGTVVKDPILLLFLTTSPNGATASHPRSLVVLEPGSQAIVVESYGAVGGHTYLTNAVTDLVVGDGATLEHHRIQRESGRAFHVGQVHARQARQSRLSSGSIAFGGRLVRNDVQVLLEGEGADCDLHGLWVLGGRQHVDTHTVVDHAVPRGTSRQLYKGVLDGRSRGVFDGRVIVRPGAQKTDAHQTNKNLLLSDGVEVDSKPQLEIFADDVKCSHGAADGQLAADALFYLESRGLGEEAARALLTYGFAGEVLSRIRLEPLRARLEALLTARLRGGRVSEEMP